MNSSGKAPGPSPTITRPSDNRSAVAIFSLIGWASTGAMDLHNFQSLCVLFLQK